MEVTTREILRKLMHIITGLVLIIISKIIHDSYGIKKLSIFLFVILIILLLADWMIADLKIKLPIYKQFERSEEKRGLHTITHSILAALVCIQIFDIQIVLFSFLILTFGDAASAITDNILRIQKERSNTGTIVMFLVSFLIGMLLLDSMMLISTMAITAALVEKNFKKVDDNLAIPIFTSLVGQGVIYLF